MNREIEEKIKEFENEFCNNHQMPVRFLRSIFYDEQDGAEQIISFLHSALLSIRQQTLEEAKEAMGKEDKKTDRSDYGDGLMDGYNQHRSESLQRLEELKKQP